MKFTNSFTSNRITKSVRMKKLLIFLFLLRGLTYSNAQCLDGDCKNGIGSAIFSKTGGVRYTGQFKNKRPNGNGIAEYPNGRRYEGDWAQGLWHGQGKLTLTDGTSLSGEWKFGKFKGNISYDPTPENLPKTRNEEPIVYDNITREQKPNDIPTPIKNTKIKDKPTENTETAIPSVIMPEIWALSVGVADYDNPTIPRLKYPDNDAWSMYAFWRSPFGGALDDDHIEILVSDAATKQAVTSSMKHMFSKATNKDLVIFFFSGHGLKGSFLPNDYDGENVRLYHNDINKMLNACPARQKLVIADACHAGSYLASKSPSRPTAETPELFYSELGKAQAGTAFMLSSLADEESLEVSSLHNSVFTYFVLKGVKGEANSNGDNIVTIQELFDFVHENVTKYAASLGKTQTPIMKGDYDPNMPVAVVKK